MVERSLPVVNELGLHARVACRIVRAAAGFESSLIAKKDDKKFDLKNLTDVISTNARHGDVLLLEAEGADEDKAAAAMEELFKNRFGER